MRYPRRHQMPPSSYMGYQPNVPPPQPPPLHNPFADLPDASRLHVIFGKPLPEAEVHDAFDRAAPGLQYVSRHHNKPFAFVKYANSASAMLAMIKLHGSTLLGQKLRVTLADPPDSSSRKRQRDVVPRKVGSSALLSDEEGEEDDEEQTD